MAYVKTTWETGDVITADKLNNMEGGIEAHDPFIVKLSQTDTGEVLDKTWQEIADALDAGKYCPLFYQSGDSVSSTGFIISVRNIRGTYYVHTMTEVAPDTDNVIGRIYTTTSADGYPEWLSE